MVVQDYQVEILEEAREIVHQHHHHKEIMVVRHLMVVPMLVEDLVVEVEQLNLDFLEQMEQVETVEMEQYLLFLEYQQLMQEVGEVVAITQELLEQEVLVEVEMAQLLPQEHLEHILLVVALVVVEIVESLILAEVPVVPE